MKGCVGLSCGKAIVREDIEDWWFSRGNFRCECVQSEDVICAGITSLKRKYVGSKHTMFYASWLVSTPAGDWLIVLWCKAWLPRIGSSFSSLQSLAWLTTDEHEACVAVRYTIHNTSILSAPDFWKHLPSYKKIGSPAFFQCTNFFFAQLPVPKMICQGLRPSC